MAQHPNLNPNPALSQPGANSGPAFDYPVVEALALQKRHLLDYARMLYKRRWTALVVFFIVVGTVVYNTWTAIPVYEARTRLLMEVEGPKIVAFQEVVEQDRATTEYQQTQLEMLQSRALAKKTIERVRLRDHPEFRGGPQQQQKQRFSVRRLISSGISAAKSALARVARGGDPPEPVQAPAQDDTAAEVALIDAFLGRLTVSPVRNSRLVDVMFRSSDPALAAAAANVLANSYIEENVQLKFLVSKDATDWLTKELDAQRKQVEASEMALQKYREQSDAFSSDDRQKVVTQKLADLNAAVTKAKTKRIEKETLYRQLRAIQDDPVALSSHPAILTNSFIQQLESQLVDLQRQQVQLSEGLGDKHPDMIKLRSTVETTEARLHGEIARVVASIGNELLAAEAEARGLLEVLDAQRREGLVMTRNTIEYDALERNAKTDRTIFEGLLQRVKETHISGQLATSNIRIVDVADVPQDPIRPRKGRSLLLAVLAGLGLGVGLAFFLDYLDNRIKSPDEIRIHLGLPFFGLVPLISRRAVEAAGPLISNGVPPQFAEALRAIRTNILFSFSEEGCHSLVVTSVGPEEGKTVIASNVAVGLAQAGLRVLFLDADMRRPRAHELFNVDQEPGLSTLLTGNAQPTDVVRQSPIPTLWVLPAGPVPPNPAELLLSPRFRDFIATLHKRFDWVILDSPPVMSVTDASIIAHVVTGVLFVAGAEMSSRHAAEIALEQLEAAKGNVVGAVLNRVNLDRNGFYFAPYHHRQYSDYYTQSSRP